MSTSARTAVASASASLMSGAGAVECFDEIGNQRAEDDLPVVCWPAVEVDLGIRLVVHRRRPPQYSVSGRSLAARDVLSGCDHGSAASAPLAVLLSPPGRGCFGGEGEAPGSPSGGRSVSSCGCCAPSSRSSRWRWSSLGCPCRQSSSTTGSPRSSRPPQKQPSQPANTYDRSAPKRWHE